MYWCVENQGKLKTLLNVCLNLQGFQKVVEITIVRNILHHLKAGMHNLRPASKMWPEKAFKPARKAQKLIYLACLFHINILLCFTYKHISFGPRTCKKNKNFGPAKTI